MNLIVKNKPISTLTLMVLVHSHPYICVKINTACTCVCLHYVSSTCFPTPLQTCIHPHAGRSDRTGSCLFVCIRAWLDWDTEWFRSKVCISINHFSLSLFWHGTINANSSATDATQILQESLMEYFDGILILNGLLLKRVYLLHKIIHIISFKIIYIIAKSMLCFGGTYSNCKCWLQMVLFIMYIFNINKFPLNAISVCFYPIKDISTSGPTLY